MDQQPLILLVDDEADFREIFSARLTAAGYRVEVAEDGKAGIEKAKALNPDLILMDMRMPNMSGGDALLTLKGDPATANTKVLFLSNLGDPQPEIQDINNRFSEQVGAVGYLRKTDDLDILIEKVKAVLAQ